MYLSPEFHEWTPEVFQNNRVKPVLEVDVAVSENDASNNTGIDLAQTVKELLVNPILNSSDQSKPHVIHV